MKRSFATLFAVCALACTVGLASAVSPSVLAAKSFDFKDPKGVNGLTITVDSELEPIVGSAGGITGTVNFDPADPKATTGTLTMDVKSIKLTNERMSAVLYGSDWLDAEAHPAIVVKLGTVTAAEAAGENTWKLTFNGEITMRGQTKPMTYNVRATFLPDRAGDRMRGAEGHLLVLRTSFTVKRLDFGIKPDSPVSVVGDEIVISGGLVGMAK